MWNSRRFENFIYFERNVDVVLSFTVYILLRTTYTQLKLHFLIEYVETIVGAISHVSLFSVTISFIFSHRSHQRFKYFSVGRY